MKRLFVTVSLAIFVLSCWSSIRDDFLIGNYGYIHPAYGETSYTRLFTLMQEANYNSSICSPVKLTQYPWGDLSTMLSKMEQCDLTPILYDNYTNYSNGVINEISPRNLSMGIYAKFEAEFDSREDNNIPESDRHIEENNDIYHYHFDIDRIGAINQAFGRRFLFCSPTTMTEDVIVDNLRHRWKNHKNGVDGDFIDNADYLPYKEAFEFSNGSDELNYIQYNKLYMTVCYKVSSDTSSALKFGLKLLNIDANDNEEWYFKEIRNTMNNDYGNVLTYTAQELNDPAITYVDTLEFSDFRKITFELELSSLLDGEINSRDNDDSRSYLYNFHSRKRLNGITPYIYWEGNHDVRIDYIEFEDDVHKQIVDGVALDALENRLNKYSSVHNHYTVDEPKFTHFDSHKLIDERLNNYNIITTNWPINFKEKKPNNTRYFHPGQFVEQAQPDDLMIDFYPLKPDANWNNIDDDNFVQFLIDWWACANYRRAKHKAEDRPFYVVPCTAGKWDNRFNIWVGYQYPTINMIKCLQYLPLCYGVDGIIDFPFYKDTTFNDNDPEDNGHRWYALVNDDDNDSIHPNGRHITPQYYAIKEANEKVYRYGNILKDLTWLDATTIKANGIQALDSEIYIIGQNQEEGEDKPLNNSIYKYFPTGGIKTSSIGNNNDRDTYNGYIHIGLFEDEYGHQKYMLVNRRTDFVEDSSGLMNTLNPDILTSRYEDQVSFFQASPQCVNFDLDYATEDFNNSFGSHVALYDPYSKEIYRPNSENVISVELKPGEGKMLEFVNYLSGDITISPLPYLDGHYVIGDTLNIDDNVSLSFSPESRVCIKDSTIINICKNAKLSLSGSVEINSTINADSLATLELLNTYKCLLGDGVKLNANNGTIIIENSSLEAITDKWGGLYSDNLANLNSCIIIKNSELKQFSNLSMHNGFLTILDDSNLYFTQRYTVLKNVTTNIHNSILNFEHNGFRYFNSNLEGNIYITNTQFNGSSNLKAIELSGSVLGLVVLDGVTFNNFNKGINIVSFNNSPSYFENIVIADCEFNNCDSGILLTDSPSFGQININTTAFNNIDDEGIGVYIFNTNTSVNIDSCSFSGNGTGISTTGISPFISNSIFSNLTVGVKEELTISNTVAKIKDCTFRYCDTGFEGRESTTRLEENTFQENITGIKSLTNSVLDISYNAYNIFDNSIRNLYFPTDEPNDYLIKCLKGHNDFYHRFSPPNTLANDFDFTVPIMNRIGIDASYNWFSTSTVRVAPASMSNYVSVNEFDPVSNSFYPPSITPDRFYEALCEENSGYNLEAYLIYKLILDEAIPTESSLWASCVDGIYRNSYIIGIDILEVDSYMEDKVEQFSSIDNSLSEMIDNYIMRVHLLYKNYNEVITILENRINCPTSEIDSLSAVLDLEIVLKLANASQGKSEVNTTFAQYKYKTFEKFEEEHAKHWDIYNDMTKDDESDYNVLPPNKLNLSNYPNPFNPETTIMFGLPEDSDIEIKIYNLKGQVVKKLVKDHFKAGYHAVVWNGKNDSNQKVASGVYLTRITSKEKTKTKKIMLMK